LITVLGFEPTVAWAQAEGSVADQPASRATSTPPVSAAPSAAITQPLSAPVTTSACIAGELPGAPISDAHTAAALVCEALRARGANVSAQPVIEGDALAAGHASAFRVEVRPLGRVVILQVGYESPIRTRLKSQSLQLRGIEEVTVAAPRMADALLRGTDVRESAQVDNLVGQETRSYAKQYGEMSFGIGLIGLALPSETWAGYGAYGRIHYEARRYAIGADLRIAGSDRSEHDIVMTGISLGGRYFLSDGDVTGFVGGGAGILWLSLEDVSSTGTSQQLRGSGLAGFGEVGVEFLRLHETRFDILLRLEAPGFELTGGGRDKYRMPLALMASFSF
jgi:hypothetical protein